MIKILNSLKIFFNLPIIQILQFNPEMQKMGSSDNKNTQLK
jgi:hypothetical protein